MKMTKLKTYIFMLSAAFALAVPQVSFASVITIELQIEKMQNLTDQYKVRKILSSLDGIQKVILIDGDTTVFVTFDDDLSSLFDVKTALSVQGYPTQSLQTLDN